MVIAISEAPKHPRGTDAELLGEGVEEYFGCPAALAAALDQDRTFLALLAFLACFGLHRAS